jgi:hypothetical protein
MPETLITSANATALKLSAPNLGIEADFIDISISLQ